MQEKIMNGDFLLKFAKYKLCIVGLGYVGLPLAVEFSKVFPVIGFDINEKKIEELKNNIDSMNEVDADDLTKSNINFTSDHSAIKQANFIVIAVPTPITKHNNPDLSCVKNATEIVGKNLSKGTVVVYESTVYPGVTEEICIPILEKFSNMKAGIDFKVGYSPERVNPGDKEHTIDKVVKVVSGMDNETLEIVSEVYSRIAKAGIYKAPNIKVAEASKVVENIQRDLNIALMNELSLIFHKMGINTKEVLEAAGTKWNFHKYCPGLVGGHCIGVDPYYLTYKAQELGYNAEVILAGRNVNNYMPKHIADLAVKSLIKIGKKVKSSKVLLMGLTFKENVKDARNSRAKDLINELREYGADVIACEPMLDNELIIQNFGVENFEFNRISEKIDCIIIINKHNDFASLTLDDLKQISSEKPLLIDIKNMFDRQMAEKEGIIYYSI